MLALNEAIKDMGGEEVQLSPTCTTYADYIIRALNQHLPGHDDNLDGKAKFDLFRLAMKVDDLAKGTEGAIELSASDIDTIKKRVGRAYSPLICGRIWMLLDPVSAK